MFNTSIILLLLIAPSRDRKYFTNGNLWYIRNHIFSTSTTVMTSVYINTLVPLDFSDFKVTPDLHGCPPVSSGKKIHMRAVLGEGMAHCISLEGLINVDFGKKYEVPVFLVPQKKVVKMTAKMTMFHSIKQMN